MGVRAAKHARILEPMARYGTCVPHWKYVRFIRRWALQLQQLAFVVWFCKGSYHSYLGYKKTGAIICSISTAR